MRINMSDISKIKLIDSTFQIKDVDARSILNTLQTTKQDKLVAGVGLKIENNMISLDSSSEVHAEGEYF